MTAAIATGSVDLTCLIDPDADPHTYQATPEDRKAIEMAQLILYGGYDFEPTIINLVQVTKTQPPKWQWMGKPLIENRSSGEEHEHHSGRRT